MAETPSLDEMQKLYDQMRAKMIEMKKTNERLSSDFSSSQEKIQKLQEDLASSKASKTKRHANMDDIPFMQNYTDSDSVESEDEAEFKEEDPLNDAKKTYGDGEVDPMSKRMILIERYNRRLMKLMSQFPGAPTLSIVEHPDGYVESLFVEKISKVGSPKNSICPSSPPAMTVQPTQASMLPNKSSGCGKHQSLDTW